ncbi:hypothetical protein Sste5344_005935 [Sporothrix stenoceras]
MLSDRDRGIELARLSSARFRRLRSGEPSPPIVTAQESAMAVVMEHLTDKPTWFEDIFDDAVIVQWRNEITESDLVANPRLLQGTTWPWIVRELRDKAADYKDRGYVRVLDTGLCVCKVDATAVLQDACSVLWQGIKPLLDEYEYHEQRRILRKQRGQHEPQAQAWREWLDSRKTISLPLPRRHISPVTDVTVEVADVPPFTEYLEIVQTEATAGVHGEAQADTQTNVQAEVLAEIEAETEDGMFGNLDDFYSDSGEPTPANVVLDRLTAHWDMPTEDEDGQPLVLGPRLAESEYRIAALVDPRLYPLVNGRTQYLSDGNTVALDNVLTSYGANSSALETCQSKQERHQYLPLPCEVAFTGQDTKTTVGVQITSYINNLYPDHKNLYRAIEQECEFHDVIGKEQLSLPPLNSDVWQKANEYLQDYGGGDGKDGINNDDDEDMWGRLCDKTCQRVIHRHPEPGLYDDWKEAMLAHEEKAIDPVQQFQEQGLQVLVAINSIALTPDGPAYGPGATTWQAIYARKTKEAFAEAVTQNKAVCQFGKPPDSDGWSRVEDNIVATAMVAFDVTNVTTPHLAFQQSQSDITEYSYDEAYKYDWHNVPPHLVGKDNDKDALAEVLRMPVSDLWNEGYGVYDFQDIGTVAMREGRVVAFPAALGHRINPFCLVDANQPGHVRWLTLSLVDPGAHGRTVSTRTVPPQQHDWWATAVRRELTSIGGLSNEIIDWILEDTDKWPMGQDEAEWHRDRTPK